MKVENSPARANKIHNRVLPMPIQRFSQTAVALNSTVNNANTGTVMNIVRSIELSPDERFNIGRDVKESNKIAWDDSEGAIVSGNDDGDIETRGSPILVPKLLALRDNLIKGGFELETQKEIDALNLIPTKERRSTNKELNSTPLALNLRPFNKSGKSKITKSVLRACPQRQVFATLRALLHQMFISTSFDSTDVLLSTDESLILNSIIRKKVDKSKNISKVCEISALSMTPEQLPKRRIEESYKFVLKLTYKHLQNEFYKRQHNGQLSESTKTSIHDFYAFYFSAAAAKVEVELSNFYLPLTADSKWIKSNNVVAKTINSTYIGLVAHSPDFVADLLAYVKESFMKDYDILIHKKIDKLINKWENLFNESMCAYKAVETICDFITYNKKSKLPWFHSEALQAVAVVLAVFEKNAKKFRVLQ